MSSQGKKMKTTSIMLLPDDLLLSCLARVSRLYYPSLTLVSKTFRSLITSPEIYKRRSLLGCTESCLYICLPCDNDLNHRWFTLYRKPDKTLTLNNNYLSKKSSGHLFVPIPSPINHSETWNHFAVGSEIYGIGRETESSSKVSVLDCRYNTWGEAPSMRVDRRSNCTASVVDGKIYVAGDSDNKSLELVEVFDPNTQNWSSVGVPDIEISNIFDVKSVGLEGELYLLIRSCYGSHNDDCVVYDPEEGKWDHVGLVNNINFEVFFNHCVIDNVLFHWSFGSFKWFDSKVGSWKIVKGVEGLPFCQGYKSLKLVNYNGNLVVFWDGVWFSYDGNHKNMISCAEISLERRNGDEIWGKVEWFDLVLTVPGSSLLKHANVLSATV